MPKLFKEHFQIPGLSSTPSPSNSPRTGAFSAYFLLSEPRRQELQKHP